MEQHLETANLDTEEKQLPAGPSRKPSLRCVRMLVQAAGLAAAVAMGVHGTLILNEPTMRRFDEALVWYGFALLALVAFAWDPSLPRFEGGWRSSLAVFWSSHRLEIILLAGILGFAIFMRTYKLGVFPPSNGLTFEEGLNGNIAFRILQGERPLFYPVRYLNAVGIWLWGENTFGLRFFGITMSILTVPVFYLLLRELVRVPSALFGTALLAAAYWPSLVNRVTSATTFWTMLLAYLLVRGLRTRSALAFLGVGILASLISYEYEDVKPVPFYVLGFLAALALWHIGFAARKGLKPALAVIMEIFRKAWRPALAFAVAAGIVAGPLIMGTHLGKDPYLSSLHRQEADRYNLGTPGLLAPNWEQQAKWSAQLFQPLSSGPPRSRLPLSVPNIPALDPISGMLLAAGVFYAAFTFFRPYRIFFLVWFVATLGGGALLLSRWEPWKFWGLLPVGLVLATFLVDDVRSLWLRLRPTFKFSPALFSIVLLGAVAYVCFWNADTLFGRVVNEPMVLREYTQTQAQWYTLCDYLRSQGKDSFAYVFHSGDTSFGFWRPRDSLRDQFYAWGDHIWVCHDLQGASLSGLQEAWPLRDVPSGSLTLAFLVSPDMLESLKEGVEQGYPELSPDQVIEGPLGSYYVVGYVLSDEIVRSRQGLYGEYTPVGAASPVAESVDKAHNISWADAKPAIPTPFTVRWTGLVYLGESGAWLLDVVSDDAAQISLDGGIAYSANDVSGQLPPARPLAAGWHTVEITLDKQTPGGSFLLRWVSSNGAISLLEEQDMFALHPLTGWLHTRTFLLEGDGEVTWQRIDHSLDKGSKVIAEAQLGSQPDAKRAELTEETFSSRWSVRESGDLMLSLKYPGGVAAIYVDGNVLKRCEATGSLGSVCQASMQITSGEHIVEIQLKNDKGTPWSGANLFISTPEGPLPEDAIEIRPFR